MSAPITVIEPIGRALTWGEEVYFDVATFLRSAAMATTDYVDLPDAVLSRWPAIKESQFEAEIAWVAVLDEIERREAANG